MRDFVIIGAGPAGLTAAYTLSQLGHTPSLVEACHIVGGLARTENYKGYCFDLGGHRFYTKSAQVQAIWQRVLGDEFLIRPRLSRIYYRGKFFDYPLKPVNAVTGLGVVEGFKILASYFKWAAMPHRCETTFEHWVTNRFGKRLFEVFFKSYTEKVWGIPCSELSAEWAEQRIKQLSLLSAVAQIFLGNRSEVRSLVQQFHYPRQGPGMLWNRVRECVEQRGGRILLKTKTVAIRRKGWRVESLIVEHEGRQEEITGTDFISSMPITQLIKQMDPPPPALILRAADELRYRAFLTVCLIVDRAQVFDDNWIYVHEPRVRVARIQNFKNWSPEMVPDPSTTSLGLEYFCDEGDALWKSPDSELIDLGAHELSQIGLVDPSQVIDGCVFRVPKAYPVYDSRYTRFLSIMKEYLYQFENLQTIGRNGLHRYNNQDHAMLTGIAAARNALFGESIDLWNINAEHDYLEEICETDANPDLQRWHQFGDAPAIAR
jgi:protoporphyrinogen oxidase